MPKKLNIEDEIERRGAAILATDGSVSAVVEAMRGCPRTVFWTMDRKDAWYPVPAWHASLRAARNASTALFEVLS